MTQNTEPQAQKEPAHGLASLKLAQLQALASQLGIKGISRMRKAQLVEAISDHQRGGAVADRDAQQAEQKKTQQQEKRGEADSQATKNAEAQSTSKDASGADDEAQNQPKQSRNRRGRSRRADSAEQSASGSEAQKADEPATAQETKTQSRNDSQNAEETTGDSAEANQSNRRTRERRGDSGRGRDRHNDQNQQDHRDSSEDSEDDSNDNQRGQNRHRRNRDRQDRNRRNRRNGQDNQQQEVDTSFSEDDVLLPVAGILDVLDNYAFVRTSGYLPGTKDVYVSMATVKKYGLRKGDAVVGAIKAPTDGDESSQQRQGSGGRGGRGRKSNRQKFNALVKVDTVNGQPAVENPQRVEFNKLVPLYPNERLRLEHDPKDIGPRIVDLVAPIGKGQRGLIVSPPKAGKTMMLQSIANAISTNNPEVKLMMVLVDERPEEVTDMQRSVKGEVIASTFDRPAEDHTTVAELAIERAKRMVEMGHDVVVLLDSMTRLGRAYNLATPASGRILSGGVDSAALYPPKKFFGAARNIENGGSLTILATALVETGSRMDEVIFEEFKGTGNMELRLSRELSERRIFPAVDVNASGTRREENLLSPEEIKIMWKLRRVLSGLETQQSLELLTNKIKDTKSNAEFLMLVSKTTLGSKSDS